VRRQLINAATKLRDEGRAPDNVDRVELDMVRSGSIRTPAGADWKNLSESARRVRPGELSANDVGLII
jgi:hypothetical protein